MTDEDKLKVWKYLGFGMIELHGPDYHFFDLKNNTFASKLWSAYYYDYGNSKHCCTDFIRFGDKVRSHFTPDFEDPEFVIMAIEHFEMILAPTGVGTWLVRSKVADESSEGSSIWAAVFRNLLVAANRA